MNKPVKHAYANKIKRTEGIEEGKKDKIPIRKKNQYRVEQSRESNLRAVFVSDRLLAVAMKRIREQILQHFLRRGNACQSTKNISEALEQHKTHLAVVDMPNKI